MNEASFAHQKSVLADIFHSLCFEFEDFNNFLSWWNDNFRIDDVKTIIVKSIKSCGMNEASFAPQKCALADIFQIVKFYMIFFMFAIIFLVGGITILESMM